MSKDKIGEDGFRLVTSKRSTKSRKVPTKIPNLTALTIDNTSIDKESVTRKILAAKEELLESTYYKSFFSKVNESLLKLKSPKVVELLSFGLGHLGECTISRYQLALLICLKDKFEVQVSAYDPIFYTAECEILNGFGITVIRDNEEGKRQIKSEGVTIVYLPHCPKQLTNNLLWKNWGIQLTHAILICNSLSRLIESQPKRILIETVPYLVQIFPYLNEFCLENNFRFTDIFNDMAIHVFPEETINSVPKDFWETKFESSYGDCPEFITSEMMKKLKI